MGVVSLQVDEKRFAEVSARRIAAFPYGAYMTAKAPRFKVGAARGRR